MSERFVHIVDDDAPVRNALLWLCKSAKLPTRAFENAEAFLDQVSPRSRGVVLLDLRMPGMGGLAMLERHVPHPVAMPVIVLTAHGDVSTAVKAVRAGARTMLEKPASAQDLLREVHGALEDEEKAWSLLEERLELMDLLGELSPREREVMDLLVLGRTSKDIGLVLGISQRTVEVHRARVLAKTRSDNTTDLARRLADLESSGLRRA